MWDLSFSIYNHRYKITTGSWYTTSGCDEQNGFQSAMKLSKKRNQVDILDEGNMKFGRMAD